MRKLKWFNNIVLMSFFLGPIEVRVELDRKVTYFGVQWQTKRRKLHVYLALLFQAQFHVVFPARPLAQASGAQGQQSEGDGGAGAEDVPGGPEQPGAGAQAPQGALPEGEDDEGDVPDPQTASTT